MTDSRLCRACNTENEATATFCKQCGKPLINNEAQSVAQADITQIDEPKKQSQQDLGSQTPPGNNAGQASWGFQNQLTQSPNQSQGKPKAKLTINSAQGLSAYVSVVALILGALLFLLGQQVLDSYAGLTWYYTEEAARGNLLRVSGGLCCILGIIGLVRYYVKK